MTLGANVPHELFDNNVQHGQPKKFKFLGNVAGHPICRYVGVEIEFDNFKEYPDANKVAEIRRVVHSYGGVIEFDTPHNVEVCLAPARGATFEEQVREVCAVLVSAGAKVSALSGLHLHIDVRDMKFNTLGRVMVAYSKYEPLFVRGQPYARMSGKFCRAIGPGLASGWEKIKRGDPIGPKNLFDRKASELVPGGTSNRYKAVNFAAYHKYQTVEVRLHEGTLDADDIIAWARFWAQFVENASKIPLAAAKDLPTTFASLSDITPETGYIKTRMAKYKDQWTEPRLRSVIPDGAGCSFCVRKTVIRVCPHGQRECAYHEHQHC